MSHYPVLADDAPAVHFNPDDEAIRLDPWPTFRALRERAPVYKVADRDLWVLSRYRDIDAALRDPETFSSQSHPSSAPLPRHQMLFVDPPEHTAIRRLVAPRFTPRVMGDQSQQRGWQALAERFVDEFVAAGGGDFVGQVANRLPMTIIAQLLGVPDNRIDDLREWTINVARYGPGGAHIPVHLRGSDFERRAGQAVTNLLEFTQGLIDDHRAHPREDVTSMLITYVEQGHLHPDDLLGSVQFLISAGQTTTTNLIANGMHILARDPALWERMRAAPDLVGPFVEEVLRYDAPVISTQRKTTREVVIDGTVIPAAMRVYMLLGAANRDPEEFPDPDRFDPGRHVGASNRIGLDHFAFSVGVHHCLGAPLVRVEGPLLFRALLERVREVRLPEGFSEAAYRSVDCGFPMHGFKTLPLTVTPAR